MVAGVAGHLVAAVDLALLDIAATIVQSNGHLEPIAGPKRLIITRARRITKACKEGWHMQGVSGCVGLGRTRCEAGRDIKSGWGSCLVVEVDLFARTHARHLALEV